ncbi:MAG: hypothetical protein KatS3mg002_1045 [Candidatus Woesearchaeota archaeon]|jgi:hypothetical protein|nr:MAG: hypothetical protein KatS3mg002_1045 [Candidatus Woesearchaeota archaeon]
MIDNESTLISMLMADLKGSLMDTMKDVKDLHEKNVEINIYANYTPVVYERQGENGGLLGSFKIEQVSNDLLSNELMLFSYPYFMNHDPDAFIHGSYYWVLRDIRELLEEIILEGKQGNMFPRREWGNYYEETVSQLDSGRFEKYIEKYFRKRKLKFKKE